MARVTRLLAVVAGLTVVSYPLGLSLRLPWLLPVLNTAPAYAGMVWLLRQDRRRDAVVLTLLWAVTLALCGTCTFALWAPAPDPLVLHGPAYRDEMLAWILTGVGREGDIRQFAPQHAAHLAAFVALTLLTGSVLSMVMGAVLMNYMSFYVASLARAGVPASQVVLFGWQPWAICRVAAFCILGAVLAEPLLAAVGLLGRKPLKGVRPYALAAAGLLVLDVILKAALAPAWGLHLRAYLGP